MPKARNQDTERAILSAAWELFLEKGVTRTSYTDLAERSGVSRPLVQRYFPKKGLVVVSVMADVRSSAAHVCDTAFPGPCHPLARLYRLGQVYAACFFASPGTSRLALDVLSSREMTQCAIAADFRWTVAEMLPQRPDIGGEREPDELVIAMGGAYELAYSYLRRGLTPKIGVLMQPCVLAFARCYGIEEPPEGLVAYAIAPDELGSMARDAITLVPCAP